ncbi:leucocin a secretion protein [Paucilactobacillus hokkaidonensis]|nr:leucocin a secretion protein [Paucilactobacillus hokkaidonensis]
MMDTKYLESSEFYDKRFRNFATLVIIPAFVLLLLTILFGVFAKKEIVTKATGQIIANKPLATIQSTSSNRVDLTAVTEGKFVRKGNKLITFANTKEQTQIKLLTLEKDNLNSKIDAITLLQTGINENKNTFSSADNFGMSNILFNYLSQNKVSQANSNINNKSASDQQTSYEGQKDELNTLIKQYGNKISDYKSVISAVNNGSGLSSSNSQKNLLTNYQAQAKQMSNQELKSLQVQTTSDLKSQVDQLQETLDGYTLQEKALSTPSDPGEVQIINVEKTDEIKQNALTSAASDLSDAKEQLAEVTAKLDLFQADNSDNTIYAPATGVIHSLVSNERVRYYPKGSEIAAIYPRISKQKKIAVECFVQSSKIVNLKKGQQVRFKLTNKNPKSLTLNGKISKIDSAATQTKAGNFFRVKAELNLPRDQRLNLHYGIQGQIMLVTDHKTYFNYYKDLITSGDN